MIGDRCLRGPIRCAERSIVDGGVTAGTALYGPLCATDHRSVRAALDDLPWLRLELSLALGQPASGGDGGTTRVHPDLPIREDVDATMRELDLVVFSWAEIIGYELRLSPTTKFYAAARRIAVHLDTLYHLHTGQPVQRWVSASAVYGLPPETPGTVRASGEALVTRYLSGGHGALELHRLWVRGCGLIRRDAN